MSVKDQENVFSVGVESSKIRAPFIEKESRSGGEGKNKREKRNSVDLQRGRDREFRQHKATILSSLSLGEDSRPDMSPKGNVDIKCLPLIRALNLHDNYVTTSSCSGRIALFHSIAPRTNEAIPNSRHIAKDPLKEPTVKRGSSQALGWLLVKHGALTGFEMEVIVYYFCGPANTSRDAQIDSFYVTRVLEMAKHQENGSSLFEGELGGLLSSFIKSNNRVTEKNFDSLRTLAPMPLEGNICLKMEPYVLHVECRTMESAKILLNAAVSDSGFRNSGVTPPGKKIMCGIRHASGLGLDVPLVLDGVNYSQREYLWALLILANEKMEANEKKAHLLTEKIIDRISLT